jgi:hypothetical protein
MLRSSTDVLDCGYERALQTSSTVAGRRISEKNSKISSTRPADFTAATSRMSAAPAAGGAVTGGIVTANSSFSFLILSCGFEAA